MEDGSASHSRQPTNTSASLHPDATASSTGSATTSARLSPSQILPTAFESYTSINFTRPFFAQPAFKSRDAPTAASHSEGRAASGSKDTQRHNEARNSLWDRRAANKSSDSSNPLKVRRGGTVKDKKLTISVYKSEAAKNAQTGRGVVSESNTSEAVLSRSSSLTELTSRPEVEASSLVHHSSKVVSIPSGNKTKENSPSQSFRSFASTSSRSGGSETLATSAPTYEFNPDFWLGSSEPLTANSLSPRSDGNVSPTKPSPTYAGMLSRGVKSRFYTNAHLPPTPISPYTPAYSQCPPTPSISPHAIRNPTTPNTPKTPLAFDVLNCEQGKQPQWQRNPLVSVQPNEAPERGWRDGVHGQIDTAAISPMASAVAGALTRPKSTSIHSSTSLEAVRQRNSDAVNSLSKGHQPSSREDRRPTATTSATDSSDRASFGFPRRVSEPVATVEGLTSLDTLLKARSLSLALPSSSLQAHRGNSIQLSNDEGGVDLIGEKCSRVNNLVEAKQWILGHLLSHESYPQVAEPGVDNMNDNQSIKSMRRPTYAASVFQQAQLIEAERQATAALISSSTLDLASVVNAPATNLLLQGVPIPSTPRSSITPENQVAVVSKRTRKQQLVHYLQSPFRFVAGQVDIKYLFTMMDPRELLFPITLRKLSLWLLYGGVLTMFALLDRSYHWWHKFDHAVHEKSLAIMGVLYGFEPSMMLIIMLVARVPDARVVPDRSVFVQRGSVSPTSVPSDEPRHSHSSSDSVSTEDMANQMPSMILEEEQDVLENGLQTQEGGHEEADSPRTRSALPRPRLLRGLSTRSTAASANSGNNVKRRHSEPSNNSAAVAVPRTPGFDPRSRRSMTVLHELLNMDNLLLQIRGSRSPTMPSHQMRIDRVASRETRRNSYFSEIIAGPVTRGGTANPGILAPTVVVDGKDEKRGKDLVDALPDLCHELDEEKKPTNLSNDTDPANQDDNGVGNNEVRLAMEGVSHPSLTESTGLVIPCHNADIEVLKAVLIAALVHFEPWQIFIVDNGNSASPPEDMEGAIHSQPMFAQINYIWLPIGNKNIAQFVGAKAAAVLDLDYVLTIDDDVIIPANFIAPMHIISESVTAVCYPITAVDHKGDRPLFVGWQDIEYKMSALSKMAEFRMCGVLFPHGAASFWNRETMIQVLRRHDLVFYADDVKMGLELQTLGQHMGIDASICFETVAPETFIGPPRNGTPNYYNQRVRSWEMARHTLYWRFFKRFLFSLNGARTPVAIGWQKFTQWYILVTNLIDWIRLPIFIFFGSNEQFWLRTLAFVFLLPLANLLPYRFIKTRNRPELQPHMLDMLTFGIYKLLYSLVCIVGGLRSLVFFFPNQKHKPSLDEMEKAGDARCIWLKDDFMRNSAGQSSRLEPQQISLASGASAVAMAQEQLEPAFEVTLTPPASPEDKNEELQQVAVLDVTSVPPKSPHDESPTVQ